MSFRNEKLVASSNNFIKHCDITALLFEMMSPGVVGQEPWK